MFKLDVLEGRQLLSYCELSIKGDGQEEITCHKASQNDLIFATLEEEASKIEQEIQLLNIDIDRSLNKDPL